MITSQKLKLLINDPKFRQLSNWSQGSRQQALYKIYANHKQMRRGKVIQQCLSTRQTDGQVDTSLDFIQSRIHAVEKKIVNDIQNTLDQKQGIQQKYKQLEQTYDSANKKYKKMLKNISPSMDYETSLQIIENEVNQIRELYQENLFLKNMNNQIKKRIRDKKEKAKISDFQS